MTVVRLYRFFDTGLRVSRSSGTIRDMGPMPNHYVFCDVGVPDTPISRRVLNCEAALAKIESPVLSREYGDA
jgi:hypothetical protein